MVAWFRRSQWRVGAVSGAAAGVLYAFGERSISAWILKAVSFGALMSLFFALTAKPGVRRWRALDTWRAQGIVPDHESAQALFAYAERTRWRREHRRILLILCGVTGVACLFVAAVAVAMSGWMVLPYAGLIAMAATAWAAVIWRSRESLSEADRAVRDARRAIERMGLEGQVAGA